MTKIMMEGEYQTRDGQKRRVLCVDAPGRLPVIAISQSGQVYRYLDDGRAADDGWDQPFDLVPVHKRHKRTVWVHVHFNGDAYYYALFTTEADSKRKGNIHSIACLKLDLDFAEGEGL